LTNVIFESDPSLQQMIERAEVDLEGSFDICFVECDGVVSFPGYTVSIIPSVDDLFHLVRD
jgi:hypothetical protein